MTSLDDLKDPVKAEAFVRECIDDAGQRLAELETRAHRKIQEFRELYPDEPEAQRRYISGVLDQLHIVTEPIRQNREAMISHIVRIEMTRFRPIIVLASDIA